VLPVHNQAEHIGRLVDGYVVTLSALVGELELLLIPNASSDNSVQVCEHLAAKHASVSVIDLGGSGGWGRAVRAGLEAAQGDTLCFTNSARTTPEMLALVLTYARAYPDVVVKANRRLRDHWPRRLGSLVYNLECRVLFDLAWWDVNGTPKVFPRSFGKLLELRRNDDLIDAEFSVVCRREGYPLIEVPFREVERHGGRSTTGYRSAVRMYVGAYRLWLEARRA